MVQKNCIFNCLLKEKKQNNLAVQPRSSIKLASLPAVPSKPISWFTKSLNPLDPRAGNGLAFLHLSAN